MKANNTMQAIESVSFTKKLLTWVTLFFFLFQYTSPSIAAALRAQDIQDAMDNTPEFVSAPTQDHLYAALNSELETTKFVEVTTAASFQARLEEYRGTSFEHDFFIPLYNGSSFMFVPQHRSYTYTVGDKYVNVGSKFVQSRYVRAQVQNILGRSLVDSRIPAYATEDAQINTLYENAYQFAIKSPAVQFGEPLNYSESSGPADMIWPEKRTINGQEVLVPIVYLTAGTVHNRKVQGHIVEFNGHATFASIDVDDVDIKLGRDAFLEAVGHITLEEGSSITGSGNAKIVAGGTLTLLSSLVSAVGDLVIAGKNVLAKTLVHRYDTLNQSGGRFGEITSISSTTGDVVVRSYGDIQFAGVDVAALQGGINFASDGNIYVGPVRLDSHLINDGDGGWSTSNSANVDYLTSSLSAEDTISLVANGSILIDATEIVSSSGHIEMLAGLGITIQDSLSSSQYHKKGKFGKTKKEVSAYKTVAMRSLLDAGKGINLHTEFGDITLKAVDIASVQGTKVKASNGAVNLLITKETDHYSYSAITKKTFTTKTISRGHDIETIVPNTIVGGFTVEALQGLNVEYKGDPTLSLDDQVAVLAKLPGMEWMADVKTQFPNADWTAVEAKYKTWDKSKTSLSPAFAAVIAIAVAVLTSGAGSAFAGAVGSGGTAATATAAGVATVGTAGTATLTVAANGALTALGTAVAAGTSAMISQFALALANGIADGDVGQAMDDFTSNDTLRSLVVSMVTAGAMAKLNADFFKVPAEASAGDELGAFYTDPDSLSLLGQATQAVTHATVQAGVSSAITGGDFDSLFKEQILNSVVKGSVNEIGKHYAQKIGLAYNDGNGDLSLTGRYIAHAALGCGIGAVHTAVSGANSDDILNNGCASGAGGAVVGELTADIYADIADHSVEILSTDGEFDEKLSRDKIFEWHKKGVDISKLVAAFSVALVGGDANIAALTGANAAANNALSDDVKKKLLELKKKIRQLNFYKRYFEMTLVNSEHITFNSAVYGNMDKLLSSNTGEHIQTDWFAAASLVTQMADGFSFGLGALDIPGSFLGSSWDAEDLLEYVSFNLALDNQAAFDLLSSGQPIPGYEGLSGDALDLALVDKEQALVTKYMNEFLINNPDINQVETMEILSTQFDPSSIKFHLNLDAVKLAIQEEFADKGEKYDMSIESHRVRLGYHMVNQINSIRN